MKYIILTYEPPQDFESRDAEDADRKARYWAGWRSYIDTLLQAGIVESMHNLLPDHTATTLRIRKGSVHLYDGPYANTDEQVGGYFVIDVSDLDRALEWAQMCPAASSGAVEVRPLNRDCGRCCEK